MLDLEIKEFMSRNKTEINKKDSMIAAVSSVHLPTVFMYVCVCLCSHNYTCIYICVTLLFLYLLLSVVLSQVDDDTTDPDLPLSIGVISDIVYLFLLCVH